MNMQLTVVLWLVAGLVFGGALGRLGLGARATDWASTLLLGVVGAVIGGLVALGTLHAAEVALADEISIGAAALGACLLAGAFVLSERRVRS